MMIKLHFRTWRNHHSQSVWSWLPYQRRLYGWSSSSPRRLQRRQTTRPMVSTPLRNRKQKVQFVSRYFYTSIEVVSVLRDFTTLFIRVLDSTHLILYPLQTECWVKPILSFFLSLEDFLFSIFWFPWKPFLLKIFCFKVFIVLIQWQASLHLKVKFAEPEKGHTNDPKHLMKYHGVTKDKLKEASDKKDKPPKEKKNVKIEDKYTFGKVLGRSLFSFP